MKRRGFLGSLFALPALVKGADLSPAILPISPKVGAEPTVYLNKRPGYDEVMFTICTSASLSSGRMLW